MRQSPQLQIIALAAIATLAMPSGASAAFSFTNYVQNAAVVIPRKGTSTAGGSKLYEDGNLHIATDDYLYLDAPARVVTKSDLQVNNSLVIARNLDGGDTGSKIYDDNQLHVATDDYLYLDAPVAVFVQNRLMVGANLVVGNDLTVGGNLILPARSITGTNLANGTVTATQLASGTVTATQLATGAVTSTGILDGTIATADLANNAVTAAKISDGTITAAKFAPGAVALSSIPDGTITTAKLQDGLITAAKIGTQEISNTHISGSAGILGSKIQPSFGAQNISTSGTLTAGTINGQTIADDSTIVNSLYAPILNAGTALEINGANVNTAGTLTNVAYLNQANTFSIANNAFSHTALFNDANIGLSVAHNATIGEVLTVSGTLNSNGIDNHGGGMVNVGALSGVTSTSFSGPISAPSYIATIATKTTNYTLTSNDNIVLGNPTTGPITFTLPTAVGIPGQQYTVKKVGSSSNTLTLATSNSQSIDGASTYVFSTNFKYVTVVSDGANWLIIANN